MVGESDRSIACVLVLIEMLASAIGVSPYRERWVAHLQRRLLARNGWAPVGPIPDTVVDCFPDVKGLGPSK